MYSLVPLFLVLVFCVSKSSQKASIKEIKALSDRLMVNYSKHILPTESDEPFHVRIGVDLEVISGIDEVEETFSAVVWFNYVWLDESIKWDIAENNISYITLGWTDVWKPMLQLLNPQTDSAGKQNKDRTYDSVIYYYDGEAFYDELMTIRTSCDLDMSFYPFDIQDCDVKMRIVGSTKYDFNLTVHAFEHFSQEDHEHGSWELLNINATSNHGEFTVSLRFKRRPLFILLNIILPLFILALLTPIVFLLPKKSGERVGYSVAMLLAISVYMTIVSEHLPENSNPAPLMPIMIFIWYTFDACVVLVVVINTKINLTEANKELPKVLHNFVLFTRKLSCWRSGRNTDNASPEEIQSCIEMEHVKEKEGNGGGEEDDTVSSKGVMTERATWQELSHTIDKWFFVFSILLKIALPIIFLTIMVTKGQN